MLDAPTYLVGFAEAVATPEVCFSLRAAGTRILCFYRLGGRTSFARLKFVEYHPVTAPEVDLEQTIRDVLSLMARTHPDQIAPCDDAAVLVLSRLNASGAPNLIPTKSACDFALDKQLQTQAAAASGFAAMRTMAVESEATIRTFAIRPAVLKPRQALDILRGSLDKGPTFVLTDNRLPEKAQKALAERPYLIQEYKVGVGEGLFGIARDGEIYAPFGHRRVRMMNPAGSGASACVSRVPGADEIEAATDLVRRANWQGPFMIELLRDNTGKKWFMEFNGRFWGSLALARRCGLDMPRIAFDLAQGKTIQIPAELAPGFARHLGRDLLHLLFVLRGRNGGSASNRWRSRFAAINQVVSPNRLRSFYNYDPVQPFFFIKDATVTLSNAIFGRRT
jgi:hypothetical protein